LIQVHIVCLLTLRSSAASFGLCSRPVFDIP
jgi:hypothetical protein